MADHHNNHTSFEPYNHHDHDHHHQQHVPQQSRRDKLRVNVHNIPDHHHLQPFSQTPLYHNNNIPSLNNNYNQIPSLYPEDYLNCPSSSSSVKREGMSTNLISFALHNNNNNNMYNHVDHHHPSSSNSVVHELLNPSSSIHQPCSYTSPSFRPQFLHHDHHQSFHHVVNNNNTHDQVALYKPAEPTNTTTGQSLSLSLSSSHNNNNNLPLELNLQRFHDDPSPMLISTNNIVGHDNNNNNNVGVGGSNTIEAVSKSTVPLGPFTGYASVLKGSRFLKPAQQLLEELCDFGREMYVAVEKDGAAADPYLSAADNGVYNDSVLMPNYSSTSTHDCTDEQNRKKSRLLSMLDEVYKRYKQYYQQMQAAVASFESVAGLSGAAPFANLAVKAMFKHFRTVKNAITDQLHFASRSHGKVHCERDETQRVLENSGRTPYDQRPFHMSSTGFVDQPVWRPQRGLPERAVTVLRAWLFEHFLHPYPTDTDKLMLAKQTGLSRNQVSNWFINARVRLWKPMVEEIHMLETRQGHMKGSENEDQQPTNGLNDQLATSSSNELENASTSMQRIGGDFALKRSRDDITEHTPRGNEVPLKFPYAYNLLHNNPHSGVGVNNNSGGGVSLTLGLHQNGVGLPESTYPISAARRLGLDGDQGFVVSGFGGQNRQFGREIMDGQLMHEFVG